MLDPVFVSNLLVCAFFIGELSPLILSDINDQWLLTPVIFLLFIFFCLLEFMCFPSLSCAGGGLSDARVIMGVVGFLGL